MDDQTRKEVMEMFQIAMKRNFNRKIGDTPTDNLQYTTRKYVNMYGPTTSRPIASIASYGQQYFDTTIGRPIYFNPNSSVWTDGAGSVS